MRFTPVVALAISAAVAPAVLADNGDFERREIYDLVARAAAAEGQGSEAFSMWGLADDVFKGASDLFGSSNNNNNNNRRDVDEFIARALEHEGYRQRKHYGHHHGAHRFHEHEHRPSHFRGHEDEREHRYRTREVQSSGSRPMQGAQPASSRPAQGVQHAGKHRTHKHHHGHHRNHHKGAHKDFHPTDAHRKVARELFDMIARDNNEQSQALSLGSIFKIGKDAFDLFGHSGNNSRRAVPEDF